MNDWAISRNRYWGTPLPLWRCECGHMEMIGSRSELQDKAIENIDKETIAFEITDFTYEIIIVLCLKF